MQIRTAVTAYHKNKQLLLFSELYWGIENSDLIGRNRHSNNRVNQY